MPYLFQGLPSHILINHATVVVLPLATLALVLAAFSGRARARFGVVLPIAGLVSLVLVPLTTASGEKLQAHVQAGGTTQAQIEAHVNAARALLPWTIGLAVMTIVVWLVGRYGPRTPARSVGAATTAESRAPRAMTLEARSAVSVVVAVLATVAAVGTAAETAYIGHLGSKAVWSGTANTPAKPGGESGG